MCAIRCDAIPPTNPAAKANMTVVRLLIRSLSAARFRTAALRVPDVTPANSKPAGHWTLAALVDHRSLQQYLYAADLRIPRGEHDGGGDRTGLGDRTWWFWRNCSRCTA